MNMKSQDSRGAADGVHQATPAEPALPVRQAAPLGGRSEATGGHHVWWMAWTLPVAIFFTSIVLMLIGMTVWELKSPTTLRKGWLPMETTRGDRLFIGLLSAAYVNLAFVAVSEKLMTWLSLENEPSVWISFVISMALLALIMRKG
jgi:predicted small integral membrane protein